MNQKCQSLLAGQSGAIAVLVVLSMAVFLWLAAVMVDYAQVTVVSSELKKAAEAGALAGAGALYNQNMWPTPDWAVADSKARDIVKANWAGGKAIEDCQVTVTWGYFSLTQKNLQGTSSDPPYIKVVVAKSAGNTEGPLQLFFASPWGGNTVNLAAQAVAILSLLYPIGVPVGTVMPLAVLDQVNTYWASNSSFTIGEGAFDLGEGQWTSFKVNSNAASYVKGLIANGNPSVLQVGDSINIQNGAEASNYGNAGSLVGKTVYIPLVANIAAGSQKITGFSAFYVEDVSQRQKYIQGHFDKTARIPKATKVSPVRQSPLSLATTIPQLVYFQ